MSTVLLEDYLGDGVYATWDGWSITLDLRAQLPTSPVTTIALEPEVLEALDRFRARCRGYEEGTSG